MMHSPGHIRDQFEELVWALAKRQPAPTDYYGEPALAPKELCALLRGSSDQVPGWIATELNAHLEKIDAIPKRSTFGAYAFAVQKMIKRGMVQVAA